MSDGAGWRELSIIDESEDSLVGRIPMTRFESWCEIKPVLWSALWAAFERPGAVTAEARVEICLRKERDVPWLILMTKAIFFPA